MKNADINKAIEKRIFEQEELVEAISKFEPDNFNRLNEELMHLEGMQEIYNHLKRNGLI